jgi:hypothetical protein
MRSQAIELSHGDDDVFLTVAGDRWRLLLSGVRRINPDWFVQVLALGPRVCSFTVRVPSAPHQAASIGGILRVIEDWLRSGDSERHVFLEVSDERTLKVETRAE